MKYGAGTEERPPKTQVAAPGQQRLLPRASGRRRLRLPVHQRPTLLGQQRWPAHQRPRGGHFGL